MARLAEFYGAEGGYRFWGALDLFECEELMEETYYLRSDRKTRQRKRRDRPSTASPSKQQQDDLRERLQQQYGGDTVEMAGEDGATRSVNLSDFSFN